LIDGGKKCRDMMMRHQLFELRVCVLLKEAVNTSIAGKKNELHEFVTFFIFLLLPSPGPSCLRIAHRLK